MNISDFLLCTFQGDTQTPPTNYVAEITNVDVAASTFNCRLVDTGQQFTFRYSLNTSGPWQGSDTAGTNYIIDTHDIYTAGAIDPYPQGVAAITFADNKRYFCYVESVDPTTDVLFYYHGTPKLSIQNNVITKSSWDQYPVGGQINLIEGYVLSSEEPQVTPSTTTSTSSVSSGSTKYLFVDVSPWEKNPNWEALINAPDFYGAILKATQGRKGYSNDKGWFKKNWSILKNVANARYGSTWFRGAYLFLNLWDDGVVQADYYLDTITDAGGWDNGDMIPAIDVELGHDGSDGKPRSRNQDASSQQIIDCTTACADRLRSVTGRNVMLYGRGAMRDKGIRSKMGCDVVWNPCYTSTIVMHGLEAWTLDDVVLWQYCGDGKSAIDEDKLPKSIPGFGNADISVYIEGKNKPSFDKLRERMGIGT